MPQLIKMNLQKLITRSFFHYLRGNALAAGGLAVATAVITGAFIIGNSLSHSLEKAVTMRLGNITHSVTAGERLFTGGMGRRFAEVSGMAVSRGLVAEGMVMAERVAGGEDAVSGGRVSERLNRVQVLGLDENFSSLIGTEFDYSATGQGEVIVSENMARRLQLEIGDFFMLRMKRAGVIPMNTPLVSDARQSVTRRVRVAAIAGDDDYGRFNLRVSQTAPYNIFVDIGWLNMVMELDDMANIIFISSPGADPGDLESHLNEAWDLEDANLTLRQLHGTDFLEMSSERVFIEEHVSSRIGTLFEGSMQFLTWFVNSVEKGERSTPYSFVTAGSKYTMQPGEMVINRWLAGDLGAVNGDTLLVRYWETGPRRELTERDVRLVVTGIVEMEEAVADSVLMPFLPGLSDAGSCRDWDAGVPVVLDRIRDKDEEYWDNYRGTPKAWISLEQGRQLWTNRFGNLTSVWLPGGEGRQEEVRGRVRSAIDPLNLGFQVNELREQGLRSAAAGTDFGMLFGGLGFFVMLAGVMLFFLLMLFNMEKRAGQIRLFSSLGYPLKLIRKIYIGEGMLVAVAGSVAGILLAVIYAMLVRQALSELWQDIVRTDLLLLVVRPASLASGLAISLFIAPGVIIFTLNRYILKKPASVSGQTCYSEPEATGKGRQRNILHRIRSLITVKVPAFVPAGRDTGRRIRNRAAAAGVLATAAILVIIFQTSSGTGTGPVSFFIAGGLLIPAFLLAAGLLLLRLEMTGYLKISMTRLSMKNLARNPTRSLSVIIMLALGIFVVIATGSFRKDAASGETHPEGGTGGFLFVAEATVPVLYDLNGRETRLDLNIPPGVEFVQFMASYADDASCLNLNEVANPRIIAADPSLLEGRFTFARRSEWLDRDNPWQSLNMDISLNAVHPAGPPSDDLPGTGDSGSTGYCGFGPAAGTPETAAATPATGNTSPVIPAVADQTVIQWGLNKRVGDTLFYTGERGREIGLVLVGGLASSVFQGNVIISEKHFLRHFPSTSGSSFFLIDAGRDREEEIREELEFIFRDHGWEMVPAVDRLNEFNSVENTYLGIFMMLGAFGILLGVVGLAVVMARSIAERRAEIALYASLGFKRSQITSLVLREYMVLLAGGLAAGVPPAMIAILPSLLQGSQQVNPLFLTIIIAAIFLNGIFWIAATSLLMIRDDNLTTALRND